MARLRLETFGEPEPPATMALAIEPVAFEEAKLAAFEQGYAAGWEDAIAAQDAEIARLRADLGTNLRAIALTHEEAKASVIASMAPLLHDMVAHILPQIARAALPAIVLEHLGPAVAAQADVPIRIRANPACLPQIRDLLAAASDIPFLYDAEASLGEGQVYLRMPARETRVDLDAAIAAIGEAVHTYFAPSRTEQTDG